MLSTFFLASADELFFPSSFHQTLEFFGLFESGKDGTPLGLNGALGIFGEKIGEIYRFLAWWGWDPSNV